MAKKYMPRLADKLLAMHLASKGAVLVRGAKWCGKTTTALQAAQSVIFMQDPDNKAQYLELSVLKPSRLLQGDTPQLIDEWQIAPQLWDAVRFAVDQRGVFGQFILTGSAVPHDTSQVTHTGTGRIANLTMRPMTLYESGESSGEVSLKALFENAHDVDGENELDIDDIAYLICRGGWPQALGCPKDIALRQAIDYFDTVVEGDISRVDGKKRSGDYTKRLLRAYARAVGSQASINSLASDMAVNEETTLSSVTVSDYINALKQIYVIENSLAWNPNLRSKAAIRTSDTRYFVDPSIGAAALGIGPNDFINDLNTMGLFFENMCIRDLRTYAEVLDGQVYHYRDKNGLECDAVIHLRNGEYGLIEIKLGGEDAVDKGASTLAALAESIDTTRMKSPAFCMVLTGMGKFAYKRKDGIFVVPVGCLRD